MRKQEDETPGSAHDGLADALAMMVHELGAPVARIRALAGRLERVQGDAVQQTALLTTIAAEAAGLAALVEEVHAAALGERDDRPARRGDDAPRRDER
jgi:signal transduction histidine kinase